MPVNIVLEDAVKVPPVTDIPLNASAPKSPSASAPTTCVGASVVKSVTRISPVTCNLRAGEVFPIPTSPSD